MGHMMGRIKAPMAEKSASKLAKQPGMHAVGDPPGLYLYSFGAGRSWIFRYSLNGKRRDMGLGSYGDLSLAEAREKAREKRKLVLQGVDPIEAKHEDRDARRVAQAKRMTFQQCIDGYLDAHGDAWKNPKHRAQYRSTLETYAGPVIGTVNVNLVDTATIMKILEPIWKEKTETASRLRGRLESVLDWATVRGYRQGDNPARWKGHLDKLLPKPGKVATVTHHAALPFAEVGAFMADLRQQAGTGARALEFAILTAARSGEIRGATWAEIDQGARQWIIPAERMKAGKEHRIPLSDAAVAILDQMRARELGTFIFPGAKDGKPLSDMTLTAAMRRMGRGDLTAHGFRSTFRDWAGETTAYPREVIEHALAHQLKDKAEAAYARGTLFDKRRRLMDDWGRYCAKPMAAGAVLSINRGTK